MEAVDQLRDAYVVEDARDGKVSGLSECLVAIVQHFDQALLRNQLQTQCFEIVTEALSHNLNCSAGALCTHGPKVVYLHRITRNNDLPGCSELSLACS